MMRKLLWFTFSALILAVAAPPAQADSTIDGTLNFTVTSGGPDATGSFLYDNSTNKFTSFTVNWDGAPYDFTLVNITLADLGSSGNWCATAPFGAPAAAGCVPELFILPNQFQGFFGSYTDPFAAAAGTYTVTTPEPSSLCLALLGVGLPVVMRKRQGES